LRPVRLLDLLDRQVLSQPAFPFASSFSFANPSAVVSIQRHEKPVRPHGRRDLACGVRFEHEHPLLHFEISGDQES
jgi:hypothetical protein